MDDVPFAPIPPPPPAPAGPLTLVVGYDASELARLALEEAITLAEAAPEAELHVLGVLGAGPHGLGAPRPLHHVGFDEARDTQALLESIVDAALARRGLADVRRWIHCTIGEPAEQIVQLATDVRADLILVGTHGRRGLDRLVIGSVAQRVVRDAPCPTLVMRPKRYPDAASEHRFDPEPPCPQCVDRRFATSGIHWWCEAHDRPWTPPHRYGYTDDGIARTRPDAWALW
jgi:nucleotide-binding universal stress UspA family protein